MKRHRRGTDPAIRAACSTNTSAAAIKLLLQQCVLLTELKKRLDRARDIHSQLRVLRQQRLDG